MTRGELSKKTGVPERSLQDIERGEYNLSPDVALRIAMATKVSATSLMDGEDPLRDDLGRKLSASSGRMVKGSVLEIIDTINSESRMRTRKELFEAALEAALEKGRTSLFAYSFDHWLLNTMRAMGLENILCEKLTERLRLALFDPTDILSFNPKELNPKNRKLAEEWNRHAEEINENQELLFSEKMENFKWDCVVLNPLEELALAMRCRATAIEDLQQQKSEELGLEGVA